MKATMQLRRIVTNGAKNFARSGSVSFATVLIMTVTMLIIGLLIFLSAILTATLAAIKDKVDVNVYFVTTASETDIFALEQRLRALPEVASVEYTSREDALAQFKERHAADQLTLQALEELGENPLGASLAIKAQDPEQYEGIVTFLSDEPTLSEGGESIVDRINYYQNKVVIDRLTGAIRATERAGAAIALVFALASVIIVFATVRLAIYTSRDEIAVMRLVGASNAYIRGPFIVACVLAGVLAAVLALLIFYPASWYAGETLTEWLGGFDLFKYYLTHFGMIAGVLAGSGVVLGGVSSFFAVRRYLKI
jgi:cell division transport system permease protein